MLTGKYRRIYHFHLKKCGGTTLNRWLDTLTFDERTFDPDAWDGLLRLAAEPTETGEIRRSIVPSRARTLFHWTDVVHHHGPHRIYAPENTFCFTILRDPVQRLVSQVSDWRRLTGSDTIGSPAGLRACIADSGRLSLRDFLEKHAQRGGHRFLENYLTRALAAGRVGNRIDARISSSNLCDVALHSLENDYNLIGLTEELDLSRNALCSMVGLPPARTIPTLNVTRTGGHSTWELHDARDILQYLTRIDRVIYDRARLLFDRRHRQVAEAYDAAAFETHHAGRLLARARGGSRDGATFYSVRAPIVGSGFHGRDGVRTPACAVWSGPETRTTLYVQTPPDLTVTLMVWIRGYADIRQRSQLRVRVDGHPAVHGFECAAGYADVLTVDALPTGDFVRLEIEIDETLESGVPGSEQHDPRKRGFCFDSYGWRPVIPVSYETIAAVAQAMPRQPQRSEGVPDDVFALIVESENGLAGPCSRDQALTIARTVLRERPQTCVAIGILGGRSLVACAAALRHIGAGAIYGIEDWQPKADRTSNKQAFYRFVTATNLTRHVRLIEAHSGRASTLFDQIDLLHINGARSMVDAAEDALLYARKVRGGGIIVYNDTDRQSTASVMPLLGSLCDTLSLLKHHDSGEDVCSVLRRC